MQMGAQSEKADGAGKVEGRIRRQRDARARDSTLFVLAL